MIKCPSKKVKICKCSGSTCKKAATCYDISLSVLPELVLLKIFAYLPYLTDVFNNLSKVSKRFNDLANDTLLPEQLNLNLMAIKGKNYEQILKVLDRTKRLRYLQLNFQPSSHYTALNFQSVSCMKEGEILKSVSKNIESLKILKVLANTFGHWYSQSISFLRCVSTSLITISIKNKLEVLELGIPISKDVLVEILGNINITLRSFKIQDVNFLLANEDVFNQLSNCNHLEELDIDLHGHKIKLETTEGIQRLEKLKGLKRLTISAGIGSRCSVDELSKAFMWRLESLRLVNFSIGQPGIENILSNCVNLKEVQLNVNECNIDEILSKISNSNQLQILLLDEITCLTNIGMLKISALSNLKELKLIIVDESQELTTTGIVNAFATRSLHKIVLLELDITILNDGCLEAIAKSCTNLKVLKIKNCKNVSDIGINYIGSNCCDLKELSLECCVNVGDAGVNYIIKRCKGLDKLAIKCTAVSQAYCDVLFYEVREVICSHCYCVNYKSDFPDDILDLNEYEEDSFSLKDYRYRR